MRAHREYTAVRIKDSDPNQNGMRTSCTSTILEAFGFNFRYSQTPRDMLEIFRRNHWSLRSRKSRLGKNKTMARLKRYIREGRISTPRYFLVFVPDHVLLLDKTGGIIIDTDPYEFDYRKVTRVYSLGWHSDR